MYHQLEVIFFFSPLTNTHSECGMVLVDFSQFYDCEICSLFRYDVLLNTEEVIQGKEPCKAIELLNSSLFEIHSLQKCFIKCKSERHMGMCIESVRPFLCWDAIN
jgi:hypothetical protein